MSGLKERDLVRLGQCALCDGPLMHQGLPVFSRVVIERYLVNLRAVARQHDFAVALGSAGLARAMGPDEDMASRVMGPVELGICEGCAGDPDKAAAVINEALRRCEEQEEVPQ